MKCKECISIGDMGSCQNFKSEKFRKQVKEEKVCRLFEQKGEEG